MAISAPSRASSASPMMGRSLWGPIAAALAAPAWRARQADGQRRARWVILAPDPSGRRWPTGRRRADNERGLCHEIAACGTAWRGAGGRERAGRLGRPVCRLERRRHGRPQARTGLRQCRHHRHPGGARHAVRAGRETVRGRQHHRADPRLRTQGRHLGPDQRLSPGLGGALRRQARHRAHPDHRPLRQDDARSAPGYRSVRRHHRRRVFLRRSGRGRVHGAGRRLHGERRVPAVVVRRDAEVAVDPASLGRRRLRRAQ